MCILEKYSKYKRHHNMRMESSSFKDAPTRLKHKVMTLMGEDGAVKTSELESTLKKFAEELGISIHRRVTVASGRYLVAHLPDSVKYVIGADGSHSVVRDLFGDIKTEENMDSVSLAKIVDLKFHVNGQAKKLKWYTQAYPTIKLIPYIGQEIVGKVDKETRTTAVTLRLVIDNDDAFEFVTNGKYQATFKKTTKLHSDFNLDGDEEKRTIPISIRKSIQVWLNVRKQVLKEVLLVIVFIIVVSIIDGDFGYPSPIHQSTNAYCH